MKKKILLICSLTFLLVFAQKMPTWAKDFDLGNCGTLDVGGFLRNETYLQLFHGPEDIQSCRSEFNLELDYSARDFPLRVFIQLRPSYEALFDLESSGFGDAGGDVKGYLQHNIGKNDDWDPLLREAWAYLSYGGWEVKLGRQLVTWGRSDGVYMLDFIHPFNYRNFTTFREEDTKIPLWMVNLNYWFTPDKSLQLLFIPRYTPAFAQATHDTTGVPWFEDYGRQWHKGNAFTPNITKFVFDYFAFFDDMFKSFGLPGYPVMIDEPGTSLSNSEFGLKWMDNYKGLTYSLNYFYTWTDFLSFRPNTGNWLTSTGVKAAPDRLSIFGGSFDYNFDRALGLENWILRGEVAYFKNNPFYDYDVYIKERDYIGWLFGFDKYFFVDYWVVLQFTGTYILNADHSKGAYSDLGTNNTGMGMRNEVETAFTFFMMKDYLPGDTLHTTWFLLFDDDGDWWFRPQVKYDVTPDFIASIGFNFFWGNHDDGLGQFSQRDNMFVELKYGF